MTNTTTDYQAIAKRHGIQIDDIQIPNRQQRLERLQQTLQRTDVPFPIPEKEGAKYLADAADGIPFAIGTFNNQTVELGQYANVQHYEQYTLAEHLSWACLIADQQSTKKEYACREYLQGEALFEISGQVIPDFYLLNARIYQFTQWQLATVNMIIPAELFFTCHSRRYFPVTTFMRPLECDYLQEPDIGHDVAGHVATFTIPAVANVMKNHGLARDMIYAELDQQLLAAAGDSRQMNQAKQRAENLLTYAGRIYWFMVEFGLVMQDEQIRCFGAGILSSPGETIFSVTSPQSNRILIDPSNDADLLRMANTDYLISEYQKTYFVSKSFALLDTITPQRILDAASIALELPDFTWREILPGDQVVDLGTSATSANEKYYQLMANLPIDPCLERTAINNLHRHADGFDPSFHRYLKASPPDVPEVAITWFKVNRQRLLDRYQVLVSENDSNNEG